MGKKQTETMMNEWSHFIDADEIDSKPMRLSIRADKEALKDVALRAGVPAIESLSADLTLQREQAGRVVHAAGRFSAELTLECVVSAEEFTHKIEEPVEGWFEDKEKTVSFMQALKERDRDTQKNAKSGVEVEISSEEEDPESMINGEIDLGELVVQHLILALPAYPHKDGVEYPHGDDVPVAGEESPLRRNPFDALKDWKERR
ncbi:MAG: YceD family protein [Pseudomonadota bacterium]